MKPIELIFITLLFVFIIYPSSAEIQFSSMKSFECPNGLRILPSINSNKIACVGRTDSYYYILNSQEKDWIGPVQLEKGFLLAGEATSNPHSYWIKSDSGTEILILEAVNKLAIKIEGWSVNSFTFQGNIDSDLVEATTGRLRQTSLNAMPDWSRKRKLMLKEISDALSSIQNITIPIEEEYTLVDRLPMKMKVLLSKEKAKEGANEIVLMDYSSGEKVEINTYGTGRTFEGFSTPPNYYQRAMFSPSGEYILYCAFYGPDDHVGGGFIQILDLNGTFISDVHVFPPDSNTSTIECFWLENNWIIYHFDDKVYFRKITINTLDK